MTHPLDGVLTALASFIEAEVRRQVAKLTRPAEYLSVAKSAELAGCARGTIRRWIREGKLRGFQAGRHTRLQRADLEAFLRAGRRRPEDLSPEALAVREYG